MAEEPHGESPPRVDPFLGGDWTFPLDESHVVRLNAASFDGVVRDAKSHVLVQFYSPSCGHCRKLRPAYLAVAQKYADDAEVVIAQLDAVANDVPDFEPEGFPTIILYTKHNKKGVEYDGSRDQHDLIQFVEDARAGRNFIGGLPPTDTHEIEEAPEALTGNRVEL